jgi:TolB-like protein
VASPAPVSISFCARWRLMWGLSAGRVAVRQTAIAVLPFADMSAGKDQEWFSDGLAEEIINALAQIPGLRGAADCGVTTAISGQSATTGSQSRMTSPEQLSQHCR